MQKRSATMRPLRLKRTLPLNTLHGTRVGTGPTRSNSACEALYSHRRLAAALETSLLQASGAAKNTGCVEAHFKIHLRYHAAIRREHLDDKD
jgi:hypothetical protein